MKISIMIPWRSDGPNGWRQEVWNYLRPKWEEIGWELCIGEDNRYELPFSAALAFNRAAAQATGDVLVTMGADFYPNPEAIERAATLTAHKSNWVMIFGAVGYLSEVDTKKLIRDGAEISTLRLGVVDPTCQGITAIRRTAWDAVGGMDERYSGWGWEDTDLLRRLGRKYGYATYPYTRAISLWHPTGHRDMSYNNPNRRLFESEA